MAVNKYIGSRYVPLYLGVHDSDKEYEPLSIVSNAEKTETYTSVQSVPAGISLDNETYWVQSGFSNADIAIDADSKEVDSTKDSALKSSKSAKGYLITLEASDAYKCGKTFGDPLTLNTMFDTGRYTIMPSACTGVPAAIANSNWQADLVIVDFVIDDSGTLNYTQLLTAADDTNAYMFMRNYSSGRWFPWKTIASGSSYELPAATSSTLGGVIVDNATTPLSVGSDGKLGVAINAKYGTSAIKDGSVTYLKVAEATSSTLGGVKVGEGLSVTSDGTLSVDGDGGKYVLPVATKSTLGGVIVGDNLSVSVNGTLSVPEGSTNKLGVVTASDPTSHGVQIANGDVRLYDPYFGWEDITGKPSTLNNTYINTENSDLNISTKVYVNKAAKLVRILALIKAGTLTAESGNISEKKFITYLPSPLQFYNNSNYDHYCEISANVWGEINGNFTVGLEKLDNSSRYVWYYSKWSNIQSYSAEKTIEFVYPYVEI